MSAEPEPSASVEDQRASRRRHRRRNHVDERHAGLVAAAFGLVAGAVVAVRDLAPTGAIGIDTLLAVFAVAAVTYAAASAPWWAIAVAAAAVTVTALDPVGIALGAAAVAAALWVGSRQRDLSELRAVGAGLVLISALWSRFDAFHGASALVGVAAAVLLAVTGVARRRRGPRRSLVLGFVVAGGFAVLAVGLLGASVLQSRQALTDGNNAARRGMDLMGVGDIDAAQSAFATATSAFERAERSVGAVWTQPARLVPVVAQHRDALETLAASAATSSRVIADELARFDLDSLRVVDGRLDIDAVRSLDQPLDRLQLALSDLEVATESVRSPWLIDAVNRRLDNLAVDIDDQQVRGDTAAAAIDVAPAMLGADGPRRYLIAFTTPVEARGHGGFLGNYAELTIDDGRITLSDFGRNRDLNADGTRPRFVTGPEDWVRRYGRFGFTNADGGTVGSVPWLNVTMSPHFPHTAQVMAELYPQSGGRPVDGVFAMDVETVVALLTFTGPIVVDGSPEPLTAENATQYLLFDQYLLDDNEERIDVLEEVALVTVEELLAGALPGPVDLARTLGPRAAEGRLTAWATRDQEQALFERISMDGAVPDPGFAVLPPEVSSVSSRASAPEANGGEGDGTASGPTDVVVVSFNNAGGNKIDNFLDASVTYTVTPDASQDLAAAELVLELVNSAPPGGLPNYVIGNAFGLPLGTNRLWVSVHSVLPVLAADLDGSPMVLDGSVEAGLHVWSGLVDLAPGQSRTIVLALDGALPVDHTYRLALRTPAAVRPVPVNVDVHTDPAAVGSDAPAERVRLETPGTHRIVVPVGAPDGDGSTG